MKKLTLILGLSWALFSCSANNEADPETVFDAVETVDNGHNSRNSLDWAGEYNGTLPCASCPGIQTTIRINDDQSFEKTTLYLESDDQPETTTGTFQWNADGSRITLDGNTYLVGENQLILLDAEGNRITGELADTYILQKMGL